MTLNPILNPEWGDNPNPIGLKTGQHEQGVEYG